MLNHGIGNNNVSFESKFEFINAEKYSKLLKKYKPQEVGNSLIGDFKEIENGESLFTESIGSCTTYTLTDKTDKSAIMGHYNKGAYEVTRFIKYFIDKGKAFIFGGDVHAMDDYFKKDSKEFINAKIPTTVFWGQNSGSTNILYNSDNDTCYIYKKIGDWRSDEVPNSVESLKNAYKVINVANGDEVYVNDKFINPDLINKNNDEFKYCTNLK